MQHAKALTTAVLMVFFVIRASAVVAENSQAETISASQWFTTIYAPVWQSPSSLSAEQLQKHFRPRGHMRLADGAFVAWNTRADFEQFTRMNIDAGWQSSSVSAIAEQPLTANSSMLTVTWDSRFIHGEVSGCEWYLLDRTSGAWLIAEQAFVSC